MMPVMLFPVLPNASVSPLLNTVSRLGTQVHARLMSTAAGGKKKKPRVVVLGSGWGGYLFMKMLNRNAYDLTCVSPTNHYVFTPLLPSAAVGTVEFESIMAPIRAIPDTKFLQAECTDIDPKKKEITCKDVLNNTEVKMPFDHLVISTGAKCQTFGTPGVWEHAHFLKTSRTAMKIRDRMLDCFERASAALAEGRPRSEVEHLTRFVVIGAGPTAVEFVGELQDFLRKDVKKQYPTVNPEIVLIEVMPKILSMYPANHIHYAESTLKSRNNIEILTNTGVKEIKADSVVLKSGRVVPCGVSIWTAGVTPTDFTVNSAKKNGWLLERGRRIVVTPKLQVLTKPGSENANLPPLNLAAEKPDVSAVPADGIYAIGDCAVPANQPTVPPTAQAVHQEAHYLADVLNKAAKGETTNAEFKYQFNGMATSIGGFRSLVQLPYFKSASPFAWLLWRAVYLMQLPTWSSRYMVTTEWLKAYTAGRQTARALNASTAATSKSNIGC